MICEKVTISAGLSPTSLLLQRSAANQRGLAGELAGVLGDLGEADIAFTGGVRAVQRGEAGGVVATERLHAGHLSDGQRGTEAIIG